MNDLLKSDPDYSSNPKILTIIFGFFWRKAYGLGMNGFPGWIL